MPTHMRDKTVHCPRCNTKCLITANLDRGTIVKAEMPERCVRPAMCREEFTRGIFLRQFGAQLIRPEDF